MAKKKSKQIIRPWCWYCEREFEDEKVLMQHQKAKHFKCNMCPRRLNTAGGLAVHIEQVHKLEPENLPRIDNALPGRDGYEVEIFGMEGIPAPDVADYKRRKEIELGLAAGSISQPPPKRPKVDNRPLTEQELKLQLEAHKALMGANEGTSITQSDSSTGGVYGAAPQTYVVPPVPAPGMIPPGMPGVPPPFFPGGPPPPGAFPGQPPFPPPFPGMFPPGPPPPGFPNFPPPGMLPPGAPPFPPGVRPPFPQPPFAAPGAVPPPGLLPPPAQSLPPRPPPSTVPPLGAGEGQPANGVQPTQAPNVARALQLTLPNPALAQTNPDFKKKTTLKYSDPNFSPDEKRAYHPKYHFSQNADSAQDESKGKKRARAEDFL